MANVIASTFHNVFVYSKPAVDDAQISRLARELTKHLDAEFPDLMLASTLNDIFTKPGNHGAMACCNVTGGVGSPISTADPWADVLLNTVSVRL